MATELATYIPSDDAEKLTVTIPFARALFDHLQEDGVRVDAIAPTPTPGGWILRVTMPQDFSSRYLVRVATVLVKGRDTSIHSLCADYLESSWGEWLDFAIVAAAFQDRTNRLPGFWGQQVWVQFDGDGLVLDEDDSWSSFPLLRHFARAMRGFDLFDRRDPLPLSGHASRGAQIEELQRRIVAGESLGIFGLRKIGKTSVAQSVATAIDPGWAGAVSPYLSETMKSLARQAEVLVVWLDAQGLADRSRDELLRRLSARLRRRMLLSALSVPDVHAEDPRAEFESLLDACMASHVPVCVMLDEQDLLFAGQERSRGVPGIAEVFGMLRARAQQSRGCSLVLIGRDPGWIQAPLMEGRTSPTPGWVRTVWLGPLPSSEAQTVVSTICARTGLAPSDETHALLLEWTGGHPYLLRQFGSAFWNVMRAVNKPGPHLDMTPFHGAALRSFLERDSVLESCREVEHLLASRYPKAAEFFWSLAGGAPAPTERLTDGTAGVLWKLGLLLGTSAQPVIPRLWRWWSKFVAPVARDAVGA